MNSPMEPELTPRAAASTEAVTQALRRLTRAVWVLAALLALVLMVLGAAAWVIVRGFSNAQAMSTESSGREAATSPPAEIRQTDRYSGFSEWPSERKVAEASAIIVTQQQGEGKAARDVITEVIKHAPGVEFHYKVGDVYDFGWRDRERANPSVAAMWPDHQIAFFVGSPARMNYAVSYDADSGHCSSMGGITVEQLRELARKTPDVQRKG